MPTQRSIPADVAMAIAAFLNQCQREAAPFATAEALGAIRTLFPDLDIADGDLEDAISTEAATAGFHIGAVRGKGSRATGTVSRTEAQRRIDNDTAGTRRRAEATKDGNQLI
jgi:hypothetical protein